jgi:putative SOS response-associated peptidase YedK
MCGRYTITTTAEKLAALFDVEVPDEYQPRYNAAPTQQLPVISNNQKQKISLYNWGILPRWAKEQGSSQRLINARAETVAEKATFKNSFKKRRCLVVADGYYEWKKTKDKKIPHRILLKEERPFTFAGIWDTFEDESGVQIPAFVIITVAASPSIADIHDRMPAILDKETADLWLSNSEDYEGLQDVLRPYPDAHLKAYAVSTQVNAVKNDQDSLIQPVK